MPAQERGVVLYYEYKKDYPARPVVAIAYRGEEEKAELFDGRLASCFFRTIIKLDSKRTGLAKLEIVGSERLTPHRKAILDRVLEEADRPLTYSDVRKLASEQGEREGCSSFGHGRQILQFLQDHAKAAGPEEISKRVYAAPGKEALLDGYEDGAGRTE